MKSTMRATFALALLAAACGGGTPDVTEEDLGVAQCRPHARCGRIGPEQYCADLTSDVRNCGSCGHVCRSGEVCLGGACLVPCGDGLAACTGETSSYCADVAADEANCGGCGIVCGPNDYCDSGDCLPVCPDAALPDNCGEPDAPVCVNLQSDSANCGACGRACPTQHACVEGICTLICEADQTRCLDGAGVPYCANTDTDASNCGSCGNVCPDGGACVDGACVAPCDASLTACSGACVDTSSDPANCGACGTVCGDGYSCLSGSCRLDCPADQTHCGEGDGQFCTDTTVDPANCGACGNACGGDQTCTTGICVCSAGQLCDGACVDTTSDPSNCGGCGVVCSSAFEPACVEGNCEADPTATSYQPAVAISDVLWRDYASLTFRDGTSPRYFASVGWANTTNLATYDGTSLAATGTASTSRAYRSIFTAGGQGPDVYFRLYNSSYVFYLADLTVSPVYQVSLNGAPAGTLAPDGSVSMTLDGAYFVTQNSGVVSLWNRSGGSWSRSISLEGFGGDPLLPYEASAPANVRMAVANDKFLTYSRGVLSIWTWDGVSATAARRKVTLVGADPDPINDFSLSYANGYVFVQDYWMGVWRGYRVGGL